MRHLLAWVRLLRQGYSRWAERPTRSTLYVEPLTTVGAALLVLTVISAASTLKTISDIPMTQSHTNQLSDQLSQLPDTWRAEADKKFRLGEISGHQRRLLTQQAERLRPHAETAANAMQRVGSRKSWQFAKSAAVQIALTAAISGSGEKLSKALKPEHLPTYAKRLAKVVGEIKVTKDEVRPVVGGFARIVTNLVNHETKGVGAVASSLDAGSTLASGTIMKPTRDLDDLYASKKRGLESLLGKLSAVTEDRLMAAHLANYIHRLQVAKETNPETYAEKLRRVAENVDHASYLSEEEQRLSGGKVKSKWKTTRDLQHWLDAQVIAKQREEQKEREKRLAGVTAAFSASPVQGKAPLRVRFDASGSKGDIERYVWDFGDKRGGEGMIVDHIYQSKGDFRASLMVHSTHGAKHTSSQNIAVTATRPTVSIRLGVAPKDVKAGDRVQIQVKPQVTGLEYGQINVSVAVDGKRIGQTSRGGSLQGGLARSFQYTVPAGLTGGEHVVQAVVRVRATPDDKWVNGMTSSTFRVKVESEKKQAAPLDMFIGTWHGMMVIPTGDPEVGTLRASVSLKISAAGKSKIRVSTSSPDPAVDPTSDVYDVKGNSAQVIKREFKDGMENYTTIKMTVVGEGGKRIIGSSTTLLFDPGPPREKVVDVSGSFFANRAK